jgi:menaquinone-specific isochorismate synthase
VSLAAHSLAALVIFGVRVAIGFLRRSPGDWIVGAGACEWLAQRPSGDPVFYAPDFFLRSERPWLRFERTVFRREFSLPTSSEKLRFVEPGRESFLQRANALLQAISEKRLQKAVPVEFAVSDARSIEIPALRLPDIDTVIPYGFWTMSEGMIGATPEILFQLEGRKLTTMALAGTASLAAPSLLENPKERHEHELVIRDVEQSLRPFGVVHVGETQEKFLPTLKHLFTPIEVELAAETSPEVFVKALHPTAALGGFPREQARRWLEAQPEAAFRRRFGAPFGFVDGDSAFFVVAIRNVQRFEQKIWLGSGCGVVAGSVPEKEWDELKLKRESVRRMLEL